MVRRRELFSAWRCPTERSERTTCVARQKASTLKLTVKSTRAHIVFAGGGTAGHLFPGLAVAAELMRTQPRPRITFAGTGKPLEVRLVEAAGFKYITVPSQPAPRGPREAFGFLATSFRGYQAASRFIQSENVSLVVGLGGYASAAMARAAIRRRVPIVLLEQNAMPGRATRWLAPSAAAICTAFEEVRPHLKSSAAISVTGNPVRAEFFARPIDWDARFQKQSDRTRQVLVLGGSHGSRVLNEFAPRALYKAGAAIHGWQILHQTGEREAAAVRDLYGKLGLNAIVTTFFDDVPRLLHDTDIAITRAGGSSLAELAACAVPTILVPYEKAADDHQRINAEAFAAAGAAEIVDPKVITGRLDDYLAKKISRLARHVDVRLNMATSIAQFARPNAAKVVAKTVRNVLRTRQLAGVA